MATKKNSATKKPATASTTPSNNGPDVLRKPPEHMRTDLKTIHDGLNEKMDAINSIKADIEEAKRDLRKAMRDAADLRERVYSYLVGELPEGASDPKLIDYGLRSRFAGPRGQTVTVVNEEELAPEPVPELQ